MKRAILVLCLLTASITGLWCLGRFPFLGKAVATFSSPDGMYHVKAFPVHRLIPRFAMPGDGGWQECFYRLYDSNSGRCLAKSAIVMLHDVEPPDWSPDCVIVAGGGWRLSYGRAAVRDGEPLGN